MAQFDNVLIWMIFHQDTIMALFALAEFGSKAMVDGGTNMEVSIQTSAGLVTFPQITASNSLVLQKERVSIILHVFKIQFIFEENLN